MLLTPDPLFHVVPRYGHDLPGLPARAFTLTNSERVELACDRRWLHLYGERLRSVRTPRALAYGSAWAEVLDEVHEWWRDRDVPYPEAAVLQTEAGDGRGTCPWCQGLVSEPACGQCRGSGCSAVWRARQEWLEAEAAGLLDPGGARELFLTLHRALRGWLEYYGPAPSETYRVIGVEVPVSAPIRSPRSGRAIRPLMPLVEFEPGSYRLPYPGEDPAVWVRWPWFQVGRIDVLLQHRKSGALWVKEIKSSRGPRAYLRGISVDPQTEGYCWLLSESLGHLDLEGCSIVGVQFDVSSSTLQSRPLRLKDQPRSKRAVEADRLEVFAELFRQYPEIEAAYEEQLAAAGRKTKKAQREARTWVAEHHPRAALIQDRLSQVRGFKKPAFSTASNQRVPSWLFREGIANAEPNPDGAVPKLKDYLDHLRVCRETVDPTLYVRESLSIGTDAHARYQREMFAVASRVAGHWRALGESRFSEELEMQFPRTSVCRKAGSGCSVRGPCMSWPTNPEAMSGLERRVGHVWTKTEPGAGSDLDDEDDDQPYRECAWGEE